MNKSLVVFTLLLLPSTALISISSSATTAGGKWPIVYNKGCVWPGGSWTQDTGTAAAGQPCLIHHAGNILMPIYNAFGSGRCNMQVTCTNPLWFRLSLNIARTYTSTCSWPLDHGEYRPTMKVNNGKIEVTSGEAAGATCTVGAPFDGYIDTTGGSSGVKKEMHIGIDVLKVMPD